MSFTVTEIRQNLFSVLESLLARRDEFLKNPSSDFTRKKKISFAQTMLFPMIAGADNVATELLDMFGENELPLPSAMIQRRNQVKKEAFQELFYMFNKSIPMSKTFHGYQLIACDGTRLNLPYNPSDKSTLVDNIEGRKPFNQVHLNALYDIMNDMFLDVEVQGMHEMDENSAFCRFLDKYSKSDRKAIYIADRGYGSLNNYAHALHNNQLFLIRMKESNAKSLCPDRPHLLDNEFVDEKVTVHVGRRRRKGNSKYENYHHVKVYHRYDFIACGTDDIDSLCFRVLKFPVQGTNVFFTLHSVDFFDANQLSRKVVPTKNLFLMTLRIEHCSSFNDDGSPSQMSVKKSLNETSKTLGLAAWNCGERHPREFSGVRRFLAKMRRRRRSLVTFCR